MLARVATPQAKIIASPVLARALHCPNRGAVPADMQAVEATVWQVPVPDMPLQSQGVAQAAMPAVVDIV